MEYPEELSRQARWGITVGVVILLIGLLFGPSSPVSKEDFTQLTTKVDETSKSVSTLQTDVKAIQNKVNGYESPLNEVKTKVGALEPKVTALEETLNAISSLIDQVKAEVNGLSEMKPQVDQLQKTIARLEASFSEKFRLDVSVVLQDAQLDETGNPSCPPSYVAAKLLNDSDVAFLRQMGVDKNGDGIICLRPALLAPSDLLQPSGE